MLNKSALKFHLDTMLVMFLAIIGASSRITTSSSINKTSSAPIIQYRASFMDFLLDDATLLELLKSTSKINRNQTHNANQQPLKIAKVHQQQSTTICSLLSNLLSSNQMKFCHRHQELLEMILPQVMQLTRKECIRITADLRWNCSAIDFILDRSNPLVFTKEVALVRSILNAAMMYLVVKTCSENKSHHSCGCQNNQQQENSDYLNNINSRAKREAIKPTDLEEDNVLYDHHSSLTIKEQDFSHVDLSRLDSGSPIRLKSTATKRQGCLANTPFAEAFTGVFIDSDDIRALNKAYKILNDDQNLTSSNPSLKRLIHSDKRDLAYIKWSKSAINLHNNFVGRQMVRHAIKRRCRCHGVSGVCPLQTCWDQLLAFETITDRLKSIYLTESTRVEVKNVGTLEKPDLSLTRVKPIEHHETTLSSTHQSERQYLGSSSILSEDLKTLLKLSSQDSSTDEQSESNIIRVKPSELIYLYDSGFCEPIPHIRHPGTKGRRCELKHNMSPIITRSSLEDRNVTGELYEELTDQESLRDIPGSCEYLCCNRGRRSELVLDMVTCNCRFKFCCKIECDHCLRQRLQHFCL